MRAFFFLVLLLVAGAYFLLQPSTKELVSPWVGSGGIVQKTRPLEKYSFENLRQRGGKGSEIKLEKVIAEEKDYTAWLFAFQTEGKKVTGQLNLPKREGKLAVVVMIRGYADDEVYFTGLGTRKAAGIFAENGFITLAPDFLGFGGSDWGSTDILENRFARPVTVLDLLASVGSLPQADPEKVAIWGHSNGGQIALSVLEISAKPHPTTLWAPVTRGFPESVSNYMGEMDDQGLKVKEAIDRFLREYDPKKYSIDTYFADVAAPILLHQGTADTLVPVAWSDSFATKMEVLGKQITYYKYRRNDHNLKQSWDLVVARDLAFFRKYLK